MINNKWATLAVVLVLAGCLSGIFAGHVPASNDEFDIKSWQSFWEYREKVSTTRLEGATIVTLQAMLRFLNMAARYIDLDIFERDRIALAGLLETMDAKKENCGARMGQDHIAAKIKKFEEEAQFKLNTPNMLAFQYYCESLYFEICL